MRSVLCKREVKMARFWPSSFISLRQSMDS